MRRPVAVVVKGYPRLSETFIAQELLALERRGIDLVIVSLRRPTDRFTHPVHAEIGSPVHYLPEYLHEAPTRVLRAWTKARRLPGYPRARSMWLADFARDRTRNRVRRFGQALVLAAELGGVESIHAHFLHTPASVARYASTMLGVGWSFSAHAKDVWTTPEWEKREKLADARFGVTCTRSNLDHLAALAPLAGSGRSGLPRPGPRAVSRPRSGAAAPRRLRSVRPGEAPLGRTAGGEEGLRRPARGARDAVPGAFLDARCRGRRSARGAASRTDHRARHRRTGALAREPPARPGGRALRRRGPLRPRVAHLRRRRPRRTAERADGSPAPRRRMRGDPGVGDAPS